MRPRRACIKKQLVIRSAAQYPPLTVNSSEIHARTLASYSIMYLHPTSRNRAPSSGGKCAGVVRRNDTLARSCSCSEDQFRMPTQGSEDGPSWALVPPRPTNEVHCQ